MSLDLPQVYQANKLKLSLTQIQVIQQLILNGGSTIWFCSIVLIMLPKIQISLCIKIHVILCDF